MCVEGMQAANNLDPLSDNKHCRHGTPNAAILL